MKQLISDWVLAVEPEPGSQTAQSCRHVAELCPNPKLLSDEGKVLLLTHLYVELRLSVDQALRAARADIMMRPKAQTHRLWEEQPR
jgi:hypothetical protein